MMMDLVEPETRAPAQSRQAGPTTRRQTPQAISTRYFWASTAVRRWAVGCYPLTMLVLADRSNLHGLRSLFYEINSDSERRPCWFEVSAPWSNVRANQFPRPVNLAEPSRWFVLTVNIPSRARFAIVRPDSGLPPNGPCQAPAFL